MKHIHLQRHLSITLSALILTNTIMLADDKKENIKLNSIEIVEDTKTKYLYNKKMSANRSNIELKNTAKSIQIFNEDFIKDASLQNIEDVIKFSSNTIYTGDSHGRTNQISMRGFEGVPILIDGLKVTNKLAHPDINNFETVEVQKGPDSLQYGESSPGGIVNLVKKKPSKESIGEIGFEFNDNTAQKANIDLGGSLNEEDSLYYRLVSTIKKDKGYVNNNTDTNGIFLAPSLAYDINDNNTLTFVSEYTKETSPSTFGTYVNKQGELVSSLENTISNPDEKFKKTQKLVGLDLDSTFNTWNSHFKYRYINYVGDNADVHMPFMYNETTNTLSRIYAKQKQKFQEHALQYTVNKKLNILNLDHNITLGADYNKAYSKLDMYADMGTTYSINLSNPSYEELTRLSDHSSARDMSTEKTYVKSWGTFLQDSINLSDSLILNAGLRYSESKPKTGQKTDAYTPSLGLVYHVTPKTILYTNYSESFKPNSNKDINKKILDPETGNGLELGIKQKLLDDKFNLTAAVFKINKENIAKLDPNDVTNQSYKASGEQESKGFEIDISGEITSNLSIIASYGYTKTKDKDNDNLKLTNVPEHTANIFTTYNLASFNLPSIHIGGGARYIGNRYADEANKIELDSAIVYNANIGYKKNNWKANLSIQNLSDEKYVDGALSSNARGTRVYAGTPKTVYATISYAF
ncbi:TonB-dependent siderophore receptor [Poseidonibacter lekithochrous]|uniref:TonB-dependent siderophore receptor n=1 Tax=Poseidonibacter lekithochrous TaxID=1904463 RepID=UPI0008FC4917|nr:TonB-dependent receptor [Poseidonibacter lekithochrous]QKJ24222.1 TonB-dependent siderophore receptor [Poseidonibacter lekithochrous]